jgi:TrbL/VirB6 plasmid conjugal transfer protein
MPLLLAALISAVIHQDPGRLVRAVAVHLPLAVLGGFAAVQLTEVALNATDELCRLVSRGMGNDVPGALVHIGVATQAAALPSGNLLAGGFLAFVVALLVVVGAVLIWLELLVRSAAIYVAVLFLPLTLAGLVWPATARWAKRLVEILVALILSKFVVVAVISLAVSGLAAPTDGLAAGFGGAALLLLAGFAPFALLRLVPIVEAGVIGHLEGTSRRPAMAAGVTSGQLVRRMVQSAGTGGAAAGPAVAGTAAAPMMVAQAVGTKGFLEGLSGDDATAGSESQGSRAPVTAQPIKGERRQPATALTATGDKGAEREAGRGDRE